jgi:hypothetical protein
MAMVNFLCPACVSGSLTSTVRITRLDRNVVVSGAFFDTDGSLVLPEIKQRAISVCSNNHTVENMFNNIPVEIQQNMKFFISP